MANPKITSAGIDAVTPAAVRAALVQLGLPSKPFESTEQTITNGAFALTIPHNLGARPKEYSAYLLCKTAEQNFTVDTEVRAATYDYSGTAVYGVQVSADATNVYITVGPGGIAMMNRTTGGGFTITAANWRLIARAKA